MLRLYIVSRRACQYYRRLSRRGCVATGEFRKTTNMESPTMPFLPSPPPSHFRPCDAAADDDDNTRYIVHVPTHLIKHHLLNVLPTRRTQTLC